MWQCINFYLIFSQDRKTKKIKLSDGHTNNSNIIIKATPFQQKQISGNWSTHWKITAEKRLKKILMRSCKKDLRYDHNFACTNKGYLIQKHTKICDNILIFPLFIIQTNTHKVGPTLNYSIKLSLNYIKLLFKLFKNNSSINRKWKLEHIFMFKSYDWISLKCIHVYANSILLLHSSEN